MPIYEYRCQSCGHELEKLQKIADEPLLDCPACGKPELTKLISAAGFRLKGGGWYETDFKKDNKRNLAGDGKGESKGEAKSDGKSDGKADGKKEAKSSSDGGGQSGDKKGGSASNGKVA